MHDLPNVLLYTRGQQNQGTTLFSVPHHRALLCLQWIEIQDFLEGSILSKRERFFGFFSGSNENIHEKHWNHSGETGICK